MNALLTVLPSRPTRSAVKASAFRLRMMRLPLSRDITTSGTSDKGRPWMPVPLIVNVEEETSLAGKPARKAADLSVAELANVSPVESLYSGEGSVGLDPARVE